MQIDTHRDRTIDNLEHWGREFALHRDCDYLGHQSVNLLYVLMQHHEMPGKATGYKPLETDMRAQMIEDAVADIARVNPAMAICLRAYYCGQGRRRVERHETALMLLGAAGLPMVRASAYLDLVRRGEDRVAGIVQGLAMAA